MSLPVGPVSHDLDARGLEMWRAAIAATQKTEAAASVASNGSSPAVGATPASADEAPIAMKRIHLVTDPSLNILRSVEYLVGVPRSES